MLAPTATAAAAGGGGICPPVGIDIEQPRPARRTAASNTQRDRPPRRALARSQTLSSRQISDFMHAEALWYVCLLSVLSAPPSRAHSFFVLLFFFFFLLFTIAP
jgi:hypothetical protein